MNNQNTVTMTKQEIVTIAKNEVAKNLLGLAEPIDIQVGIDETKNEFIIMLIANWGSTLNQYRFDMTPSQITSRIEQGLKSLMSYYSTEKSSFTPQMPPNFA